MEEVIKVYQPKRSKIHYEMAEGLWDEEVKKPREQKSPKKPVAPKHSNAKSKWKSRYDSLMEVFAERKEKEAKLNSKHEMFNVTYNWIIVICIIALFASFIWWGTKVHNDNKEASIRATAYAEFEAEREATLAAEEAARLEAKNSLENTMKENAKWKAKVLYGARNFEEKYGYTKADFLTLCQCIDNRCTFYGMTVEEVVKQPDQWVGYYDSNPGDVDKYYKIALESEKIKAEQETKPVGADYVYAYYTNRGIYLSNKYGEKNGFGMWRHE